ncbi:MAG TPA: flagellin [Sphingomonas sp.]|nr:flagellin [Sphingomonas sp.]
MISGSRYNLQAEITRQQQLSQQIAQLQTDISSGVKIHVASDDPAAAARIAAIRQTQADAAVYATNITAAQATAAQVDTSLASLTTSLTRAKELMLQASNGTLNASDRAAIVTELQGIRSDIANQATQTDANGQPIFASGPALQIPIGPNSSVAAGDSYEEVFGSVTLKDGSVQSLDTIISNAIDAVNAGDSPAMAASLDAVDSAGTHVSSAQSDIGVREARLNAATDALATQKTNLADERSGLEDTDATEAYIQLSNKMTILSAAQSVLTRVGQATLFDKIN